MPLDNGFKSPPYFWSNFGTTFTVSIMENMVVTTNIHFYAACLNFDFFHG